MPPHHSALPRSIHRKSNVPADRRPTTRVRHATGASKLRAVRIQGKQVQGHIQVRIGLSTEAPDSFVTLHGQDPLTGRLGSSNRPCSPTAPSAPAQLIGSSSITPVATAYGSLPAIADFARLITHAVPAQ